MSDSEQAIEELLSGGAARPAPPAIVRARVLAAVEAEWNTRKRRRRWPVLTAAAALAVAVVTGLMTQVGATSFAVQLAQTTTLSLDGAHYEQGGAVLEIRPGSTMIAGGASRLVSANGAELRLRAGTRLRWIGPGEVELADGSLYVDTHGRSGFRVATLAGQVRDVGTRFMVSVAADVVEVAMRDGVTQIEAMGGPVVARTTAAGGDVVRMDTHGATKRVEPTSAARWEWIHEVHPGYVETSVRVLLAQIADDLGVSLEYATPGVPAVIENARMQGDLTQLAPREALRVVLATNGLALVEGDDARMKVGFQSAGQSE